MLLTHCAIAFGSIPRLYEPLKIKGPKRRRVFRLPMLNYLESWYIYGLIVLCIYENVLHSAWGLNKSLPFLPLMLTSVYCSVGVFYSWVCYYHYFLTFNVSKVPSLTTSSLIQHFKKVK